MTATWVTLIACSRIISNRQYIPCSLYQTCLVRDNSADVPRPCSLHTSLASYSFLLLPYSYPSLPSNTLLQAHCHEQNRNWPKELHPTKYGCVCPMRNAYSMWFHILLVRLPFYPYPILFAILDHIFSHFELPSPLCKYLHTAQTLPSTTHPYSALYFRTKG